MSTARTLGSFLVLFLFFLYIMALLGMELFSKSVYFDKDMNIVKDVPAAIAADILILPGNLNFDSI